MVNIINRTDSNVLMSLTSPKSQHNGTQRRVLCAVLATLIGLCAMMIALPGIYQALFNQAQAASNCHSHLSANSEGQASSHAVMQLDTASDTLPNSPAGSSHSGSSTVCSGDFMSAEGISTQASLFIVLVAVLFFLPFATFALVASTKRTSEFIGLWPPFCGHLRTHLGLRRIHV